MIWLVFGFVFFLFILTISYNHFKFLAFIFDNIIILSNYLSLVTCSFLVLNHKKKIIHNSLCFLCWALILCLCIFNMARTSVVVLVLTATFIIFEQYNIKFTTLFRVFIPAIVIVTAVTFKQNSSAGRAFILKRTVDIIREYPMAGVGLNRFPYFYNKAQENYFKNGKATPNEIFLADNVFTANNEFLQSLSEFGIWIFLIFSIGLFVVLRQEFLKRDNNIRLCTLWYMMVAILLLFSYPLRNFQFATTILLFWLSYQPQKFSVRKHLFIARATMLSLLLFSFYTVCGQFRLITVWKAIDDSSDIEVSVVEYGNLEKQLNYNEAFLLKYYQLLFAFSELEEAEKVLGKVIVNNYSIPLLIRRSEIEKALNKKQEAVNTLRHAVNIAPGKFLPRYELVKQLLYNRDSLKANLEASDILALPIKVHSPKIDEIRNNCQLIIAYHRK
ncbi:MAG: O-antigen ligase family protein [Mucilaginibacter sp.]|uniref:O-antigen ligase family protein n=1 Tax=Mucilaginibacter sp. TaxID=1882438 RepID=UPI0032658897